MPVEKGQQRFGGKWIGTVIKRDRNGLLTLISPADDGEKKTEPRQERRHHAETHEQEQGHHRQGQIKQGQHNRGKITRESQ